MKCDRSVALKKWTPTCLMLASLLLLFIPGSWVSVFKGAVLTVVGPIDGFVAGSFQTLGRVPRALLNDPESPSQVRELDNTVRALRSERDAALARVAQLERTIKSLTEAREVLGDAPLIAIPVEILEKPARVLAVHQAQRGTLLIAAGAISGIREGDPVVFAKCVVGRVIATGLDTSLVQLVTDPGFCAAAVTHPGAVEGTVHGEAGAQCVMKQVLRSDRVEVDEIVLTSGLGGTFPRGFVVGRVSKVTHAYDAHFQRVEIEPAVMPEHLETVLVLVKKPQAGP